MKKQIVYRILIILIPALTLLLTISLFYGWYVKVIRTGKIDGSTKNLSITYELKNSGKLPQNNVLTYTIDNLAFFDVDSEDETAYFNDMAFDLELHLINTSNSDMTYSVTFECEKTIKNVTVPLDETSTETEQVATSISYVACYFTLIPNNPAEGTTINSLKTIGTVSGNSVTYTDNSTRFQAKSESPQDQLKASNAGTTDEATIHMYLIGVQEKDDAKNTDFLYRESGQRVLQSYTFKIKIEGIPKSDSVVTEVEETTTTA